MSKSNPLIAFEGIDGSGKSMQASMLVDSIKSRGKDSICIHFPAYENKTGQIIKGHLALDWQAAELESKMLLARKYKNDHVVFQSLMTINRYEEADRIRNLNQSMAVVLDRYVGSSLAYGYVDGIETSFIETISSSLPKPDLTVLIDVPVSESLKRRPERQDRIESDIDALRKVRDAYLEIAKSNGWIVVDGVGTKEEVHDRVIKSVPEFFSW